MSDFTLSKSDCNSPLWHALADHMRDRLAAHRGNNDASQSVEKTEKLRGRIEELKALLGLEDDRPSID